MRKKIASMSITALAAACIFSHSAYSASIKIKDDVVSQFDIKQSDLKASNGGSWVDGTFLPYANDGKDFSIEIKGVSTIITEDVGTNCNYSIELERLDSIPYAIIGTSNSDCDANGLVVYSEAAQEIIPQRHIRVGGYVYTDKDTVSIQLKGSDRYMAARAYPGYAEVEQTTGDPIPDAGGLFEMEIADEANELVRFKLRDNAGQYSNMYLKRYNGPEGQKIRLTNDISDSHTKFRIDFIDDELAVEEGYDNSGAILSVDGYYADFSGFISIDLFTDSGSILKINTLEELSGIANVKAAKDKPKDPASIQLAQQAELDFFLEVNPGLTESDYPENLTFRINETPDMTQTANYFNDKAGVFLEASYDEIHDIFENIKRSSKVLGSDSLYPMKAVTLVADNKGAEYKIYNELYMSQTDWTRLAQEAVASESLSDGTLADIKGIVLPAYMEDDQILFLNDKNCPQPEDNQALYEHSGYVSATETCEYYLNGYSNIADSSADARYRIVKISSASNTAQDAVSEATASEVETFSQKEMTEAISAVYNEALNYVLSSQFLDGDTQLSTKEYWGYLATLGLSDTDKVKLRNYLSSALSLSDLDSMRPNSDSFYTVHDTYKNQYPSGDYWRKEIQSRHHILSMGIYEPELDTFSFEKLKEKSGETIYQESPYSLLPAYDSPVVIFGTIIAALQTIEKMEGKNQALDFYSRNGHNYKKLYDASLLIMNQYNEKWIPASDRPLSRDSIVYHSAYEYVQYAYNQPNEIYQFFCNLDDQDVRDTMTEEALADCGLQRLSQEEKDIRTIKQAQISRFMRVSKTDISGTWVDVLFPILTAPLVNYVFTGALFGEVFDGLLEDLGSLAPEEIELETIGSEEVAEGSAAEGAAAEEATTTELGAELSETRFQDFCPI